MLFGERSIQGKGAKQHPDLKLLDLRVGKIKNIRQTSEEKIFYFNVDIKKDDFKIATANLNEEILESLVRKKVIVACNLPVEELENLEINVKIMCAVSDGVIEVLEAPPDSKAGDRVFANGYLQENHWMIKQKTFEIISEDLRVDNYGIAFYKDTPLQLKGKTGFVSVKTLSECPITYL